MALRSDIYFHGTTAESIMEIMNAGIIKPNQDGKIFFSRFNWESCLMYGADRKRKVSFVVKVRLQTPADASKIFTETPGVRDTVVIHTANPLPASLLELYVRRMASNNDEPAQVHIVRGEEAIKSYLNALA